MAGNGIPPLEQAVQATRLCLIGLRSDFRSIRNEIFSVAEVAGSTWTGIVTSPKLIEPFQMGRAIAAQTALFRRGLADCE